MQKNHIVTSTAKTRLMEEQAIVILDQLISNVCDSVYGKNCTGSDKIISVKSYEQQIP